MVQKLLAVVVLAAATGCNCGPSAPVGFSQVVASPSADEALHVSLELDRNDDPMIAYVTRDGANHANTALKFIRYDAAKSAWTTPVVVATGLGRITTNPTRLEAQLARDGKTGRLGIAFQKSENLCGSPNADPQTTIHVAFSTDQGVTWTTPERVSVAAYTRNDPVHGVPVCNTGSPRIAMRDGVVHLAWYADAGEPDGIGFHHGYHYASGPGGGAWTRTVLPSHGADAREGRGQLWLALDSAGSPAVAYEMLSDDAAVANNDAILFWRSGTTAVRVADSGNRQNDVPQVALAFDGLKPRVAVHLARTGETAVNWVFRSDDGAAFTGAAVPDDGGHGGGTYLDLAIMGGKATLAWSFDHSTSRGQAGGPKLSRSTDAQSWTTSGADTVTQDFLGNYVSAEAAQSGKVTLAFKANNDDTASPPRFLKGLVLYREP